MLRERAFQSNFFVVFLVSLGGIAGISILLNRRMMAAPPSLRDFVVFGGVILVFGTFIHVLCRYFPVYAGPDGLRSYNGAGVYYDVPWAAMRSTSRAPGYILVQHDKWGTALSIPTFLVDQKGFRDYVLQHAPPDNPLRKALNPA